MEVLGYFCSVFIGIVLGLLGGGGSILSIPILVYLFHVEPVVASAYSLFIVGLTSLVGALPKYKEHLVSLKTGFLFSIPSSASIFATRKWIIPSIPEVVWQFHTLVITERILLLGLFAVLMVLASISMIRGGMKEIQSEEHRFKNILVIVEGTLIGFLTGLVGAGGGFLIIPALVFLTGLNFKTAVGTSLFIIGINSLIGFTGDLFNLTINWSLLMPVTLLAIIGIFIGNFFSDNIKSSVLRRAFGWFVLTTGCWILIREIFLRP